MKTIKIKDIEISAEELRRIVSENKELLKEPEVKGRYFFPKEGERLFNFYKDGDFYNACRKSDFQDTEIELGVYKTREQSELALDKQRATVACWKWAQENAPFEPDWGDMGQENHYVFYDHENKVFCVTSNIINQFQFTLPHFKSLDDTDAFIKACKEHLILLFTK